MFQHKRTVITNFEFHIPESEDKISGSCAVNAAVGIPKDLAANKCVRCKVNIKATNNNSDMDTLNVSSLSVFAVTDDAISEDAIQEQAVKECIPIALRETSEKIADVTETLCGSRIELPLCENM